MIISFYWYVYDWKDCHLCNDGYWKMNYWDPESEYGFDWCAPCKKYFEN